MTVRRSDDYLMLKDKNSCVIGIRPGDEVTVEGSHPSTWLMAGSQGAGLLIVRGRLGCHPPGTGNTELSPALHSS